MRRHINQRAVENSAISLITIGRKARDLLRREYPKFILESLSLDIAYATAEKVTKKLVDLYDAGKYDVVYIAYSQFKNVMTQEPVVRKLVPFEIPAEMVAQLKREEENKNIQGEVTGAGKGYYDFEPDTMTVLSRLIPQQIAAQIYSVLLEVGAGEQAARMTAMDNATRNAGDMINRLTLQYNRARQAYITKEVSEIVAGAEASA